MAGWNPWRALRAREHITLDFETLPASTGGAFIATWPDGDVNIVLDPQLDRRERAAALAHELVHEERGGGCTSVGMPPGWAAVVRRDERQVEAEVARRLVPGDELRAFVDRMTLSELGGATARDIAEHFDVPEEVAVLATRELGGTSCAD